jgi:hypothetical protein
MTYQDALNLLPSDASVSCTFGFPGEGGYSEFHRTPDGRRFEITNGSYMAFSPFAWVMREVRS